jgi:hypothetical protein
VRIKKPALCRQVLSCKNAFYFFFLVVSSSLPNGLSFAKSTRIGAATNIEEYVIKNITKWSRVNIAPVCSFMGGIIAQEIVKITSKYINKLVTSDI